MVCHQNEEMVAEGELRSHSLEASDEVRALQDSVAELRAEVRQQYSSHNPAFGGTKTLWK
jgi:hypothetical protein